MLLVQVLVGTLTAVLWPWHSFDFPKLSIVRNVALQDLYEQQSECKISSITEGESCHRQYTPIFV